MRFGFLITSRCNASCRHCTVDSGPYRSECLSAEQVTGLMDEAAAIWQRERSPDEELHFSISGGEPFLDFTKLHRIVMHGAGLGAVVACVTNGYWASSDQAARTRLAKLKECGLSLLAVSTSSFHQDFVRRERVERALSVATSLGLRTALKCATTSGDTGESGALVRWAEGTKVDQREVFPVLPYLRPGVALNESQYIRNQQLPSGGCPAATLTVREDGRAYTCCMPGAFTEFHALGNALEEGLGPVYRRFYLNGVQQALRDLGPAHFAKAVQRAGRGRRLRDGYEGVCDLCAHIGSDPVMAAIALRSAQAHATRQMVVAAWALVRRALRRFVGLEAANEATTQGVHT